MTDSQNPIPQEVLTTMVQNRVLVVDDNEDIRTIFKEGLEKRGFVVVPAATVNEALRLISAEKFDVLLSDLQMPGPGDGFTVVTAMRHLHPSAITLVLSGYPAVQDAMKAILLQADEVIVKPVAVDDVAELIRKKLANPSDHEAKSKESVAAILERDTNPTIKNWIAHVELNEELTAVSLTHNDRTGHLPMLLADLVRRLRLSPNVKAPTSTAARKHGVMRRAQGYSVAMLVEESRILQVCIFSTLQSNLGTVDFENVLLDVMTIADEVDSQLKQAMLGYMEPSCAIPASLSA